MDIPAFAEMTYEVLKDTPLADFIPTLILLNESKVLALTGVPDEEEENLREITLNWAQSTAAPDEDFLAAFRDGPGFFRIIHRSHGVLTEALYPEKR